MKKFLDFRNQVSNEELISSLKKSFEHNENALEYIVEEKRRIKDLALYREFDEDKERLQVIDYIEFVLNYVGKQYSDNLKKLGVHSW